MQQTQEQEIQHLRTLVSVLGGRLGNMEIEHSSLQIKYNGLQRDYEEAQRQLLTKVSQEEEGN